MYVPVYELLPGVYVLVLVPLPGVYVPLSIVRDPLPGVKVEEPAV